MRRAKVLGASPLPAIGLAAALAAWPVGGNAQAPQATQAPQAPQVSPPGVQPQGAQPQAAQSPAPTPMSRAVTQLFDNVSFWSQRGQPERAMQELERALTLAPNNANNLAMASRIAFQFGQFDAGQGYLAKLRLIAPNDPRIGPLSAERRRTADETQLLDQARKLAASGQKDDAVKVYRQIFQGKIPDSLAIEYYMALGTANADGFKEASDGLAAAAARWPDDASFKLAYAELQTYQESTRADGLTLLQQLTRDPAVAESAKSAWHEALLWQGEDTQTRDQINAYLGQFPGDGPLQAKLAEINASLPDEGVTDRMRAYEADAAGRKDEAEQQFLAALKHNPDDAESMIMLSILRRRQGRLAESDQLIAHAMQIAPDRHDEFVNDIGFDPATLAAQMKAGNGKAGNTGGRGQYVDHTDYGAKFRREYAHVNQLTDRGEFAAAEAELRKLMGPRPAAGSYVQLGYIQLRAGELPDAEASFRRVLASSPRDGAAMGGLAAVLTREGKADDAAAIYARLGNGSAARGLEQVRATGLRTEAQAATSPDDKARLYREAIAADPANPWTRLEFARWLAAHNQQAEAQTIMAPVAAGSRPSTEDIQAAIYWAQGQNQLDRVAPLVSELPAKERTPQLLALQAQGQLAGEIRRAEASPDPASVRSALIAVASAPDPSGTRAHAVAQELVKRGDKVGARDAIRAGLASTRTPTAAQRLQYADALVNAGYAADARRLAQQIDPQSLQPLQRTAYTGLADGLAIQESDQLNQAGQRAQAYDTLRPRLSADPDSVGLNLAVGRLYQADGKPQQALRIAEDVLRRNPSDLDAQHAVVDAAVQAGELGRARQITSSALEAAPDDPRPYLMQADIARASGNSGVALSALRKARALRQQQLSAQNSG